MDDIIVAIGPSKGGEPMDLKGKKIIALGERDSVPGEAIAECLATAGAEIVLVETECFV